MVLLVLFAALVPGGVEAGAVIANPALRLKPADVLLIYSGKLQSKNGTRIIPVDNLAEQEHFLARVLGSDSTTYQNQWTKKSFHAGLTPPAIDSTDAEVIDFVRRTAGAVGYIDGVAPVGVRVVMRY